MNALVGYTGFVGSNIYASAHGEFDALYNSKNVEEAYGTNPDLLVYAGLRAEKYLANSAPERDWEIINQAKENITAINPRKMVLISTIDVFKFPQNVYEDTEVDIDNLQPYGYNRYHLECWVRRNYPNALIIRLPGLFGKNLKKNFIYDYIHLVPFMLKAEKMKELSLQDRELEQYFEMQNNGFYRVKELNHADKRILKQKFKQLGFSALNFTDSRGVYQFYPLQRLWSDIQIALDHGLKLWHPATEPIIIGELYKYLTGHEFINQLSAAPAYYDYRTRYDSLFGGKNGYICDKNYILREIKSYVALEEQENG